jgi:hypothetical protein
MVLNPLAHELGHLGHGLHDMAIAVDHGEVIVGHEILLCRSGKAKRRHLRTDGEQAARGGEKNGAVEWRSPWAADELATSSATLAELRRKKMEPSAL